MYLENNFDQNILKTLRCALKKQSYISKNNFLFLSKAQPQIQIALVTPPPTHTQDL
jgi:hypothetical protein